MITKRLRELTVEEFANTLTHGFGLVLSVAAFVFLLGAAVMKGGPWYVASCVLYGLSLVVLYAASTFYHGTISPERKRILQIVDHCCIYILIAGSYTPFTLIALRPGIGERLFLFVWAFALVGILAKIFLGRRFPAISVVSYLVMGWVGIVALAPLQAALGFTAMALIVAGGVAYSLGVIFFAWERLRHNHAIFHVFALAGSIFHFIAVVKYVL